VLKGQVHKVRKVIPAFKVLKVQVHKALKEIKVKKVKLELKALKESRERLLLEH
jgi:hypothetical protein